MNSTQTNKILSERLRVKISLKQSDEIDALSMRTGLNRSEVTRAALNFFLERMQFYSTKGIVALYENTENSGATAIADAKQPEEVAG